MSCRCWMLRCRHKQCPLIHPDSPAELFFIRFPCYPLGCGQNPLEAFSGGSGENDIACHRSVANLIHLATLYSG